MLAQEMLRHNRDKIEEPVCQDMIVKKTENTSVTWCPSKLIKPQFRLKIFTIKKISLGP